jgi:uncharacterized membrane protein
MIYTIDIIGQYDCPILEMDVNKCNNQDIHGDVRKDNMLSTIVLSLLALLLVLIITGYIAGGIFSYKMWKSIISEDK